MQEAYLIINNSERELIDAKDVEYLDFSKIFQCPECNATLHWRSSFIREGHLVRASFVHPKGDLNDCSLRIDFGIDENAEKSILNVYSNLLFTSSLKGRVGGESKQSI